MESFWKLSLYYTRSSTNILICKIFSRQIFQTENFSEFKFFLVSFDFIGFIGQIGRCSPAIGLLPPRAAFPTISHTTVHFYSVQWRLYTSTQNIHQGFFAWAVNLTIPQPFFAWAVNQNKIWVRFWSKSFVFSNIFQIGS